MRKSVALSGLVAVLVIAAGCSRSSSSKPSNTTSAAAPAASTSSTAPNPCANVTLQATDVGITPTTINVEVMADVGSPLAPGLFQGNFDAMNAFATYVNAHGGIACRQLKVTTWDTKLDAAESLNGLINACSNDFALVGNNVLFNNNLTPMNNCADKTGAATGLPNVSALSADIGEQCDAMTFTVQAVSATCPVQSGVSPWTNQIGDVKYWLQQNPGLHGIFLVPGDLPTTIQASTYISGSQAAAGIVFDATPKVSGTDTQPAYTPRVQVAKEKGSTYVYDGSNDVAMIRMRKEANAQGLSTVKVWGCSLACYTQDFIPQGGSDIEGTYLWLGFLPFEEASYNAADQAYVTALGSKVTSWGAQAWQAGMAFQQAVNSIVATSGPNAVTRAALLTALKGMTHFTADGWIGAKALQGPGVFSPCFVLMQVQNGKFVRVYPTKPGTLDCTPSNLNTVNLDPVAEAAKIK